MSRSADLFAIDAELDWEIVGEGVRRKVLSYNDGIMMVRVAFEKGAVGTPHQHPHVQCSLIEQGAFDVTISGRTQRLTTGDTFLVPPDAVHGVVAIEQGILVDVFTPMRQDFITR